MTSGIGAPNPAGIPGFNATSGIVATAGGGQANAFQLPSWMNEVAVVATAADSVMLPPGYAGAVIIVINDGANSVQVFGSPGDTIAAHNSSSQTASATGVPQAAAAVGVYYCFEGQAGNTNAPTPASWKQTLLT